MYRRAACVLVLILAAGFAGGCGSAKDKGRNQDYDRPATKK